MHYAVYSMLVLYFWTQSVSLLVVFKHVWCVCVVYGVCSVSVCVERRSLNESRLSCVCHGWLLTSSPLLWADRGGPWASEWGRGSSYQPRCARPWQSSYSSPLLPTACWASDPRLSAPNNSQPVKQHLPPAWPRGTHIHRQASCSFFVCVFHENEAWNEQQWSWMWFCIQRKLTGQEIPPKMTILSPVVLALAGKARC